MYESAREAARDMRERGYAVDAPADDTTPMMAGRTQGESDWQQVRAREKTMDPTLRAKERLRDYQWKS